MAQFDQEFDKLILAEGYYVNDPDDKGGETYLGISRKANPSWSGWAVIDEVKKRCGTKGISNYLKKNEKLTYLAKIYYKKNYWDVMDLDEIQSQRIAHQLFDTCVNMGLSTAVKLAEMICDMPVTGKWSEKLKIKLSFA